MTAEVTATPNPSPKPTRHRPVWAEVDLEAIRDNARALREFVAPSELLAVVKADGYGHGAYEAAVAAIAGGASMLGVALVEEGIELRDRGVTQPILLLSEPVADAAEAVVAYNLIPAVYTDQGIDATAAAAYAAGRVKYPVQLKVDTGMHRVGCDPLDALALASKIASHASLDLDAVWTHFAVADEPERAYTDVQRDRLLEVVAMLRRAGLDPRRVHAANTAGAIAHPTTRLDLVRCGIGLYGIAPAPQLHGRVVLRPAMSLKAKIGFVKRVGIEESLSYGLRYTLDRDSFVATVPAGYADGIPRALGAVGSEVLVRGRRFPIAGTITMDQFMIDLGDTEVSAGEEVVLLGAQGDEAIPAQEWADKVGTIAYEIVCSIGPRVARHYQNLDRIERHA